MNEPDPALRHERLLAGRRRRRRQAGPLELELIRVARLERAEHERLYARHDRELWAEVARLEAELQLEAAVAALADAFRLHDELTAEGRSSGK